MASIWCLWARTLILAKTLVFQWKTMILEGPEGSTIDPKWTRETNLGQLGRSSHNLGQNCSKVGLCWGQLEGSLSQVGAKLEPTWSQLGLTWCNIWPLWAALGLLGVNLGHLKRIRTNVGCNVGSTWGQLEANFGQFASNLW